MTTTDGSGNYSFNGLPQGNDYTLTASKTTQLNGLESLDASQAARFVAGLDVPTFHQTIAADADGDGIDTSFDAVFIGRYVAGLPDHGIAGTWKFLPPTRMYPALGSNQTGQDFAAILVGETTGNWAAMGPMGPESAAEPTESENPQPSSGLTVTLPRIKAAAIAMVMVGGSPSSNQAQATPNSGTR